MSRIGCGRPVLLVHLSKRRRRCPALPYMSRTQALLLSPHFCVCSPTGERRTLAIHRMNCAVAVLIVNPENFPVKLDSTVMECEVADRTHGTHKMQTNSPGTPQDLLDGVVAVPAAAGYRRQAGRLVVDRKSTRL